MALPCLLCGCGSPAPLPRAEPVVRVGLQVDAPRVTLGSDHGLWLLREGSDRVVLRSPAGRSLEVRGGDDDGPSELLVLGAAGRAEVAVRGPLVARAREPGLLTVNGSRYRGEIVLARTDAGRLITINRLPLEAYLRGVVPVELGASGSALREAARAQAVVARTYALSRINARREAAFDLHATVRDQVYGGADAERGPDSRAVAATRGEVLVFDGTPIEAFYHSTCAGSTAGVEEVWGRPALPYLPATRDDDPETGEPFDRASPRFRWSVRWSAAELASVLSGTLRDSLPGDGPIAEVHDVRIVGRTSSGRVRSLLVRTSAGGFMLWRDRIRYLLPAPDGTPLGSTRFELEARHDSAGRLMELVARGGGWGHGVGMCQFGAIGRARAGHGYRAILAAYYPGAVLRDLY